MISNKKNIKTKWNLELLYSSSNDKKIEDDICMLEKAYVDFESKYKEDLSWTQDENRLYQVLNEYEELFKRLPVSAPINYFYYKKDLNSEDKEAVSRLNILSDRFAKIHNHLIFLDIRLGKISDDNKKVFLNSEILKKYKYYLSTVFKKGAHNLTEPEEVIMNLKSLPSYDLWVSGNEKIVSNLSLKYKSKSIPISEALNLVANISSKKERSILHKKIVNLLRENSSFAEAEINAIVTNKKINDELRGFKEPYSSTLLNYENEEDVVLKMIDVVNKSFKISHRFYKLKAKLLKLNRLGYEDRATSVGRINKKFTFSDSLNIVSKSFSKLDASFSDIVESFVSNGQIDVYPRIGKTGGAYCSSGINTPTFVLLNHTDTFDSLMTFAHEMGHAIHGEFSKNAQTPIYQGYSTSVAEVASTFFENLAFEEVFETLSDKEKIIAIHDRINDDIQTIFRQIACFNFEISLHNEIREKGFLSKEDLAKLMNSKMKEYLGPVFKMEENDGYFFVWWSHIRRFFYVYTYAYGQLISRSLYGQYKRDKSFSAKIIEFLSSGGSKNPEDIFESIGIPVRNKNFFESGIENINDDILKLENLLNKK